MGGGIVASDLEQIGEVLSPALTRRATCGGPTSVGDEPARRARAGRRRPASSSRPCSPWPGGPTIGAALGRNARQAVDRLLRVGPPRRTDARRRHWRRTRRGSRLPPGASPDRRRDASSAPSVAPAPPAGEPELATITTGDPYKDEVQHQWNRDPAGSHYVKAAEPHTLDWFLEVEAHRYREYAPWMPATMEFSAHAGRDVLEIGGGMGTDLAQFARHGSRVTDLDLSAGHLALAQENFRLRGLEGRFVHHDAEGLPFDDASFDLVYTNGVIHHTPHTRAVVDEIFRVLRPGGRVIAMVYARRSLHYWGVQVGWYGVREGRLEDQSIGDIMSDGVERSVHGSRPLVKVYSRRKLRGTVRAVRGRLHRAAPAHPAGTPRPAARALSTPRRTRPRLEPGRQRNQAAPMIASALRRLLGRSPGSTAPTAKPAAVPLLDDAWVAAARAAPGLLRQRGRRASRLAAVALRRRRRGRAAGGGPRAAATSSTSWGAGPTCRSIPTGTRPSGYRPIDWRLDPVSQLRFPAGVFHKDWNLMAMRPGSADVKLPWELARCQHWLTLAQAWQLTGSRRTTPSRSCRSSTTSSRRIPSATASSGPARWTWPSARSTGCSRSNWSPAATRSTTRRGVGPAARVWQHGHFIRANLENHYEVTSNHYLSNLVGLFFLSQRFADLPDGRAWEQFAPRELEKEIGVQVLPDGADFESALPYHRLVAELFLACARLAAWRGRPFSSAVPPTRLAAMIDYAASTLRPDGLMPVLGDADDGRLHVFTGYGALSPQDPRHLFAPAASTATSLAGSGRGAAGMPGKPRGGGSTRPRARPAPVALPAVHALFADAGVFVVRDGPHYLVATNGIVGTRGFGNHKHNDLLSFEWHADGQALVVDPGSHVYTGDPDSRNAFRSTRAHNTVQVDDEEQNEFKPEWLFRMFERATPEHLWWDARGYCGRHRGFAARSGCAHARLQARRVGYADRGRSPRGPRPAPGALAVHAGARRPGVTRRHRRRARRRRRAIRDRGPAGARRGLRAGLVLALVRPPRSDHGGGAVGRGVDRWHLPRGVRPRWRGRRAPRSRTCPRGSRRPKRHGTRRDDDRAAIVVAGSRGAGGAPRVGAPGGAAVAAPDHAARGRARGVPEEVLGLGARGALVPACTPRSCSACTASSTWSSSRRATATSATTSTSCSSSPGWCRTSASARR